MCRNSSSTCLVKILIALIVSAIVGVLAFFGILSGSAVVWAAFIIGIIGLLLGIGIVILSSCSNCRIKDFCEDKACLLLGSIGTIITALITFAIIDSPDIFFAILIPILAFFVTITILSLACFALTNCSNTNTTNRCRM